VPVLLWSVGALRRGPAHLAEQIGQRADRLARRLGVGPDASPGPYSPERASTAPNSSKVYRAAKLRPSGATSIVAQMSRDRRSWRCTDVLSRCVSIDRPLLDERRVALRPAS